MGTVPTPALMLAAAGVLLVAVPVALLVGFRLGRHAGRRAAVADARRAADDAAASLRSFAGTAREPAARRAPPKSMSMDEAIAEVDRLTGGRGVVGFQEGRRSAMRGARPDTERALRRRRPTEDEDTDPWLPSPRPYGDGS